MKKNFMGEGFRQPWQNGSKRLVNKKAVENKER